MATAKLAQEIVNKMLREAVTEKLFDNCDETQADLFEDIDVLNKIDYLEDDEDAVVIRIIFDKKKEEARVITKKWIHKFSDFKLKPAGLAKFVMEFRAAADKIKEVK